jgi:hypothetical protein
VSLKEALVEPSKSLNSAFMVPRACDVSAAGAAAFVGLFQERVRARLVALEFGGLRQHTSAYVSIRARLVALKLGGMRRQPI